MYDAVPGGIWTVTGILTAIVYAYRLGVRMGRRYRDDEGHQRALQLRAACARLERDHARQEVRP